MNIRSFSFFLIIISPAVHSLFGEPALDYYKLHFEEKSKHSLADTLFEKTVWHKKVSHIVIEERNQKYRVTLLMIPSYPHNYRSQNYPIYYEFNSHEKAQIKFQQLDSFLRKNGVLRVQIKGSSIVNEQVLFKGE